MACDHQWMGQQTAYHHELACTKCGRLGAAIARAVAQRMVVDQQFRSFVWQELEHPRPPM